MEIPETLIEMCRKHQALFVRQVGVPEDGPWRALLIMAHIALLQAATADETFYARLGGDIHRIREIGCLACFKPDAFGEIVEAGKEDFATMGEKSPGGGAIKRLGESYLAKQKAHLTKSEET